MIKTFIVVRFLLLALAATLTSMVMPEFIYDKLKFGNPFKKHRKHQLRLKY